jgi:GTP cyclohydrolase I
MAGIVQYAKTQMPSQSSNPPTQAEIEAVLRRILQWIGEDPDRDGLRETPSRVARAFREHFCGYQQDAGAILQKTFDETGGYDEMVVLRGVPFQSHCEHHLAPIIGRAWIAYVPNKRVVGISKLARVVDVFAKRLQIQERLTAQIADAINEHLSPAGVGVVIKAAHHCMSGRGVRVHQTDLVTTRLLGCLRENPMTRSEFLSMVKVHAGEE